MEKINFEQAYNELHEFAHVVSHDLKEPLRMIALYSELLEQRYADKLDSEGIEFLNTITSSITRMQNLINNLLTYSLVENKELKHEKVNINTLLINVLKDIDATVKDYDATIKVGVMPELKGCESSLSQLFQNLILNAIKFSDINRKPHIEIEAKNLGNDFYEISIKDNGIGIEEEYFEHIFRRFKQLHPRDEYKGTGLGLSICKKIIDMHNGEIRLKSKLGEGSTFYFSLPAC